jgi:hypothetical protein
MSISAMKQALEALEWKESYLRKLTWKHESITDAAKTLRQAIAEAEKQEPVAWREAVGTVTCYYDYNEDGRGEPLYAAPVHAIDMSQERVDETAKREYDLVYRLRKRAEIRRQISTRKSVQEGQPDRIADLLEEAADALEKREWVGLDDDIPGLGLVTEEFYNGMLCAEDILREKNNG